MKPAGLRKSASYPSYKQVPRAFAQGTNCQMADHLASPERRRTTRGRRLSKESLQITALVDLSREELIERWISNCGRPPPKGISRRLLELSAAYAMQAAALGSLKPHLRKALAAALIPNSESSTSKPEAALLTPGSQLVRVWNGRTHHVEAIEGGFIWNGEQFRSLSAIARKITGARWSGPRFFGL